MFASKTLVARSLMLITLGVGTSLASAADSHPPVVQQLVDQGIRIAGSFDAPGGMTCYVGDFQGQPMAFYLTPDGEQVVVGPMLSASGENLTEAKIQELVVGPQNAKAWQALETAHWVRDGSADAPVIVYTFTDPNCPYCHRFQGASQPWVEAGKVQLRHVVVGILRPDSLPKAATILGAEDPQAALHLNLEGNIEVDPQAVDQFSDQVRANNELMASLGLSATPSTYYKDANGQVQMKQGAPSPQEMTLIMGSPKP